MNELISKPDADAKVDQIQVAIGKLPQADCPLTHRFTPGLYIRELFMPKGTVAVSKIHRTEHPFIISQGRYLVWTAEDGVQTIQAPYCGITKPGARRIFCVLEDTVLTTFHPTTETDPQKIEETIIEPRDVSQVEAQGLNQIQQLFLKEQNA